VISERSWAEELYFLYYVELRKIIVRLDSGQHGAEMEFLEELQQVRYLFLELCKQYTSHSSVESALLSEKLFDTEVEILDLRTSFSQWEKTMLFILFDSYRVLCQDYLEERLGEADFPV